MATGSLDDPANTAMYWLPRRLGRKPPLPARAGSDTGDTRRPTAAPPRKSGLVRARTRQSRAERGQAPWAGRARHDDRPLHPEFGIGLRALDLFALPHQPEHRSANAAGDPLGACEGAWEGAWEEECKGGG